MKIARWVLPAIALVGLVGTACTPVKSQPGRNVLAYTVGNGCLPGLSDGLFVGDSDKSNSTRIGANQSREVCTNGFAGNQVSGAGVTIQVVNGTQGDSNPNTASSSGFVTGGLNQLGQIGAFKVTATGGSAPVTVTLVLDKNKDGQFLCPPGSATALCGDALAVFQNSPNVGNGNEFVFEGTEPFSVIFGEPCSAGPFGCVIGGFASGNPAKFATLDELRKGKIPGIGGDTPAVLSFSVSGADVKATVNGVEVNGQQFLP